MNLSNTLAASLLLAIASSPVLAQTDLPHSGRTAASVSDNMSISRTAQSSLSQPYTRKASPSRSRSWHSSDQGSLSPLLGAPRSHDDSYVARLGAPDDDGVQSNYRETDDASTMSEYSPTSAISTPDRKVAATSTAAQNFKKAKQSIKAVVTEFYVAPSTQSANTSGKASSTLSIYKDPWR